MQTAELAPKTTTLKFKAVQKNDPECRCCGRGREIICPTCAQLMEDGYAFLIEVKEGGTAERKSPTGFVVAVPTDNLYENKDADYPMQPHIIYFIQVSDLKKFMRGRYFEFNKTASHIPTRFIGQPYRRPTHTPPARKLEHAACLPHWKS